MCDATETPIVMRRQVVLNPCPKSQAQNGKRRKTYNTVLSSLASIWGQAAVRYTIIE